MTSNKKAYSSSSKKRHVKGNKASQPESAEEFLQAGVELEEAGEKWRAGDSTKALRFFVKAIDQYDEGLRAFPTSFDLAYNKARLQYEITQQPKLIKQLPASRAELLRVARDSHIIAWRLDGTNTNLLFNLGQVCTSLAECVLEASGDFDEHREDASHLLHQALEVLENCLVLQEKRYADDKFLTQMPASDDPLDAGSDENTIPQSTEEMWASVEEPLSEEDLFDTCLARTDALKALCGVHARGDKNGSRVIEKILGSGLQERLQLYSKTPDQKSQSAVAFATFLSAYAELRLLSGLTTLPEFETELLSSVEVIQSFSELATTSEGLVSLGEIHVDYNHSLEGFLETSESAEEMAATLNKSRWEHLSRALESFTTASKLPRAENLSRIHLHRGDCELFRARLAEFPCNYEFARKSHRMLFKNADVYYRAAQKVLSYDQSASPEEVFEADTKVAIVGALGNNDLEPISSLLSAHKLEAAKQVADIAQQGLLGPEGSTKIQEILLASIKCE